MVNEKVKECQTNECKALVVRSKISDVQHDISIVVDGLRTLCDRLSFVSRERYNDKAESESQESPNSDIPICRELDDILISIDTSNRLIKEMLDLLEI